MNERGDEWTGAATVELAEDGALSAAIASDQMRMQGFIPGGTNLTAFVRRLAIACVSKASAAITVPRCGAISRLAFCKAGYWYAISSTRRSRLTDWRSSSVLERRLYERTSVISLSRRLAAALMRSR